MVSGVPEVLGRGLEAGVALDDSAGVCTRGCGVAGTTRGKGGTGGRSSAISEGGGPRVRETLRWRRGDCCGIAGGGSYSSSASVSTESSFAVSVPPPPATRERRFGWPELGSERPRGAPVILEILYVEKRFEARRSSKSLFFSAARELATPGFAVRLSTAGSSAGGDCVLPRSGSVGLWGDESSTTTEGGIAGLSTSE